MILLNLPVISGFIYYRSQINAYESSPALHMWQWDYGAQAIALTQLLWLFNFETGNNGFLISKIVIYSFSIAITAK